VSERPGPIFVGGLSHTGKTEVRIILGAHPDLSMTRGTSLWDRHYGRYGDLNVAGNLDRCLRAVADDPAAAVLGPDPDRLRRDVRDGRVTYALLFGLVHEHHADRLGKGRWGEQLRGIERFARPIFDAFPTARMIHMIRDPRSELREERRRPGAVGWSTARWMRSAELAEANLRRWEGRYRIIRYETLALSPAETMREVCAFVGVDFLPAMRDALASLRFAPTEPVPVGSQEPARSARAFVDRYAGRDLRRFDYAAATPGGTAAGRGALALVERGVERASMTAWRLLEGRAVVRSERT